MLTPPIPFLHWRHRAVNEIDAALQEYATRRDEMDADGQHEKRAAVVDDMLDRRLKHTKELDRAAAR